MNVAHYIYHLCRCLGRKGGCVGKPKIVIFERETYVLKCLAEKGIVQTVQLSDGQKIAVGRYCLNKKRLKEALMSDIKVRPTY